MDVHTIIDAICDILSYEDKELCKYGHLGITVLYETACLVMKDNINAARLPFFEYMAEKVLVSVLRWGRRLTAFVIFLNYHKLLGIARKCWCVLLR